MQIRHTANGKSLARRDLLQKFIHNAGVNKNVESLILFSDHCFNNFEWKVILLWHPEATDHLLGWIWASKGHEMQGQT